MKRFALFCAFIAIAHLGDYAITLYGLGLGYTESNPIASAGFDAHWLVPLGMKLIAISASATIIAVLWRMPPLSARHLGFGVAMLGGLIPATMNLIRIGGLM